MTLFCPTDLGRFPTELKSSEFELTGHKQDRLMGDVNAIVLLDGTTQEQVGLEKLGLVGVLPLARLRPLLGAIFESVGFRTHRRRA